MFQAVKVGTEFLVNTATANDESTPSITELANGGFVVTWTDRSGTLGDSSLDATKAQVFGPDGSKVGSEFQANTQTSDNQNAPSIIGLASGGFVVTWSDASMMDDPSGAGIKAQIFSADGVKVGSEFLVNTEKTVSQINSKITGLANGGFVITWQDYSGTLGDGAGASIKAQIFGANGAKAGTEFLVNTETAMDQNQPSVTGLANGGFVITWHDWSGTRGDSSDTSIKAQVFDADGDKVGSEFLVNTSTASFQFRPTITGLVNGGFVITWQDLSRELGDSTYSSIKAQVFGANGARVGSEFLVNTETTNNQFSPEITGLVNGGFVVTWDDTSGTLGDDSGGSIKAQVFGADGTKAGSEFLVNTKVANDQLGSTITGLVDGGFVVMWRNQDLTNGVSGYNIKAQIFTLINEGTTGDDDLTGSSANDVIQGLKGSDQLDGGAGDDRLMGGSGDDTYVVDARGDRVVEDVDAGTDTVHTDLAKYALGANVENLTFTDGSSHVGVGNVRANWIIGGTGNDWLDGRGGADKLEGGAGNDRYVVDAAGDEVIEAADAGIDKVIASVSHTLAANVENLTLSGAAAINGAGNAGRNIIIGNAADNVLVGLAGNDRLVGGAGDDVLRGGLGKDVLTGGAGVDWFVFDTVPDKATNLDKLTDFVSGTDVLLIGKVLNTAFTTVGAIGAEVFWSGAGVNGAHDADDRLIYNTSNGVLSFDRDGTGAEQAVQIAVLVGKPALTFEDFLIAA